MCAFHQARRDPHRQQQRRRQQTAMAACLPGSHSWSSCLRRCSSRRCQPSSRARVAAAAATNTPAAAPAAASPAVGDVLDAVRCERLGDGVGVCFSESSGRLVLLVRGALPGELLSARVTLVKQGYCEAAKIASHSPHDNAATPACRHFGPCGGCSLQSLQYEAQLAHKADAVAQQFVRVARLSSELVARTMQPPLPASSSGRYGYRNKVQLAFSSRAWCQEQGREVQALAGTLGYYLPGSSSVVLPIQECSLMSPAMNELAAAVLAAAQALQLQPFDPATGQGCLRHLIIRAAAAARPAPAAAAAAAAEAAEAAEAEAAGEAPGQALMAVIVTTAAVTSAELQPLADSLMQQCSSLGLVSVVHSTEQQASPAGPAAAGLCDDDGCSSSSGRDASGPRGKQQASGRAAAKRSGRRGSSKQASTSSSRQPQRGARALAIASTSVLAGVPHLQEQLCGLQFLVSPHSFFQTNTHQAERLYGIAVAAVRDFYSAAAAAAGEPAAPLANSSSSSSSSTDGGEAARAEARTSGLVLDLYCGTGTISLALASVCRQVLGVDISADAIADASGNARRNGVSNVRFVCGDLTQLAARPGGLLKSAAAAAGDDGGGGGVSEAAAAGVSPDVIVVDPARAGLSRSVVYFVLGSSARRLVYVSCNAATQARDLQLLCGDGAAAGAGGSSGSSTGPLPFELVAWTAVDMFPQTSHVETVAVLDRVAGMSAAAAAPSSAAAVQDAV